MEDKEANQVLVNTNSQNAFSSDPFPTIKLPSQRNKNMIIIILITLFLISISINIFMLIDKQEKNDDISNIDKYNDYSFKYWNSSAESLNKLKSYMKDITDPKSSNYIPIIDRVAVFDMDGTIYGEKSPTYLEYLFFQDFVANHKNLTNYTVYKEISSRIDLYATNNSAEVGNLEIDVFLWQAKAFKEWSIKDTDESYSKFFDKDIEVFNNLKFKDAFYKPMIEVINFLQANSFNVYVVSGSDRLLIRNLLYNYLNTTVKLNKDHFLGSDIELIATGELPFVQEEVLADDHYEYQQNDSITKSGNGISKNLYMGKVRRIIREIGIQPVLGFGNTKGDISMLNYVITGNKYKSHAFMVVADDIQREYGVDKIVDGVVDTTKSDNLKERWRSYNYQIISMKDDWKTIYGDKVTKKKYKSVYIIKFIFKKMSIKYCI